MELCEALAIQSGRIVFLGDQIPAFGSGFKTAREWVNGLGMSCLSIDYDGRADILHDLNTPLNKIFAETADIVYDGGVLEHVANIGQGWQNTAMLVKPGGYVIHCNPINCYGESYYGLDPMVFRDLYEANGFTVLRNDIYYRTGWRIWLHSFLLKFFPQSVIVLIKKNLNTPAVKNYVLKDNIKDIVFKPLTESKQWRFSPALAHTFFVARKDATVSNWTWPAQSCYPKA